MESARDLREMETGGLDEGRTLRLIRTLLPWDRWGLTVSGSEATWYFYSRVERDGREENEEADALLCIMIDGEAINEGARG